MRRNFCKNSDGNFTRADLDPKCAARLGFQNVRNAEPLRHKVGIYQKSEDGLGIGFDDDRMFDCDRNFTHRLFRFSFCARSAAVLSFAMRSPQKASSSARSASIRSLFP
jgi:hypothetical protein